MSESKILGTFPICKLCGSKETISQKAAAEMKARGKMPSDANTATRMEIVPLEQPQLAVITVPCIVNRFDICAGCGFERVTRSEVIQAPISGGLNPRGGPPLSAR